MRAPRCLFVLVLGCGAAAPTPAPSPVPPPPVDEAPVEPPEERVAAPEAPTSAPLVPALSMHEGAVAPAPAPGGAPETLATWAWPEILGDAQLVAAGPWLVGVGSELVVMRADGTTPTRRARSPLGVPRAHGESTSTRPPRSHGLVLVRGPGSEVAALDPETGTLRWTAHVSPGRSLGEEHLATDDTFVLVTDGTMVGLDAETGRLLYARPLDEHERGPGYQAWRSAGSTIGEVGPNGYHVIGRDGRTGVERWRAEIGDVRLYEGDDARFVAIVEHETAVVLSASDGAELARIALGGTARHGRSVSLDGDELLALVDDGSTSVRVVAFDVTTGRRRWRSERLSLRADDWAEVLADAEVAYVCTDGLLSALDRIDGRSRWTAHPESCTGLRVYRPVETEPGIVLSTFAAMAYARSTEARTYRHLRISGRVTVDGEPRARVVVRGGGEQATTDARGRYALHVDAWDDVRIEVDCEGCIPGGAVVSATDPDTSPTIDLPLDAIPGTENEGWGGL